MLGLARAQPEHGPLVSRRDRRYRCPEDRRHHGECSGDAHAFLFASCGFVSKAQERSYACAPLREKSPATSGGHCTVGGEVVATTGVKDPRRRPPAALGPRLLRQAAQEELGSLCCEEVG